MQSSEAKRLRLFFAAHDLIGGGKAPGFMFDGRSGPKIVDWYAPNLGTLEERVCWLVHDCNGYGQDLSFEDTNLLLFAMLRDLAGYRTSKANVIQLAVSLSKSWYGEPKEGDWCRANVETIVHRRINFSAMESSGNLTILIRENFHPEIIIDIEAADIIYKRSKRRNACFDPFVILEHVGRLEILFEPFIEIPPQITFALDAEKSHCRCTGA